jgi:N-methylhydantoinase A
MTMRIAVDVGGTFTDVVVFDDQTAALQYEKVESVPQDPATGVLNGFAKANAEFAALGYFVHGTTMGLNALLTRRGARVAIVTTSGFRDVYEIGRTDREPMYDFKYRKPPTLVPRSRVLEVEERMTHKGDVLTAFNHQSAVEAARRLKTIEIDAVAVCFLHSYANPAHELEMEQLLAEECPGVSVTLSHKLFREYREYERTSTTVIDAYVKPVTVAYLEKLERELERNGFRGRFLLTRSGGGAMTVATAKEQPVHLVLSGPAGGVIGAASFGKAIGYENLITLDMGGTSADASLIVGGDLKLEITQKFETLPVSVPTIDIHTIGAGGGSIAWVDEGGHLQVGPQSAGAVPGPVCYAKGGTEPTFTDAALAIGYLDPDNFLGGEIPLDLSLTKKAIDALAAEAGLSYAEAGEGILRLTTAKLVSAVRVISIERGYHPKEFSIIAFGGAGAFQAAEVARELTIPTVIVPPSPATFSAFGMLMADVVNDFSQTLIAPLREDQIGVLNAAFSKLASDAEQALRGDGHPEDLWVFGASAEMRYAGQEHAVNVPLGSHQLLASDVAGLTRQFSNAHQTHYGHRMDDPVEVVTLRLRAIARVERPELPRIPRRADGSVAEPLGNRSVYRADVGGDVDYALYDRAVLCAGDTLAGPAIVEESSSTTVIHAIDTLTVGEHGELIIRVGPAAAGGALRGSKRGDSVAVRSDV